MARIRRSVRERTVTTHVGILGWPVEHSRSPAMHNAAFAALGLDWHYELLPAEPDRFEPIVRSLSGRGFVGANVTIPHKLRALELADVASDVARQVGAANTLAFRDDAIVADNTDVEGVLAALRERVPGAPEGMNALVLGAGGAARAALYAVASAGAASVSVWNRHPERAEKLAADLAEAGALKPEIVSQPDISAVELVINATSVGMAPRTDGHAGTDGRRSDFKELCFSADELDDRHVVVDLVYRAGGTELVRAARERGSRCVDGVDVLVHQGAASFRIWTGKEPPLEAMRSGAEDGIQDQGRRS